MHLDTHFSLAKPTSVVDPYLDCTAIPICMTQPIFPLHGQLSKQRHGLTVMDCVCTLTGDVFATTYEVEYREKNYQLFDARRITRVMNDSPSDIFKLWPYESYFNIMNHKEQYHYYCNDAPRK